MNEAENEYRMEQQRQSWEVQLQEYKHLAQAALHERDPKRSLELCERALKMGQDLLGLSTAKKHGRQ